MPGRFNQQRRAPLGKLVKNVGEAASARQKLARKRSLRAVNEHFEPAFNAAMATQTVFNNLLVSFAIS